MEKKLSRVVSKLAVCQSSCSSCFNAGLNESNVKTMVECIRVSKECAEICALTNSLLSSYSIFDRDMLSLCISACERCAEECGKHNHPYCQNCAKACIECAEACKIYNAELLRYKLENGG